MELMTTINSSSVTSTEPSALISAARFISDSVCDFESAGTRRPEVGELDPEQFPVLLPQVSASPTLLHGNYNESYLLLNSSEHLILVRVSGD